MPYKQSHPIAAFREQVFSLRTSAGVAVTGQTFATTDLQVRKPGASAFVNCNAAQQTAVVEIGGGNYVYTYLASELDTPGTGHVFKVNKAGAAQVEYGDVVERAYFATVAAGGISSQAFTTDRPETTDNVFADSLILALSGVLIGQEKKIGGYTAASKTITLKPPQSFTGSPAIGDVFEILVR